MGDSVIIGTLVSDTGLTNPGKIYNVTTGVLEMPKWGGGQITDVADAGNGKVTITSAAHGLSSGATVVIFGTTDYNGTFVIENITTDTFDIVEEYTSSQTGKWSSENLYYSPDQYGGIFGVVKRKYYKGNFAATNTGTTTLDPAYSGNPVYSGGYFVTSDGDVYPLPVGWASSYIQLPRKASTNIEIVKDLASSNSRPYVIWVDYIYP